MDHGENLEYFVYKHAKITQNIQTIRAAMLVHSRIETKQFFFKML